MKSICVFLGSNVDIKAVYLGYARKLGIELANNGIRLVYGGGKNGLMGILADTVIKHGGNVLGIITDELHKKEGHTNLTNMIVVKSIQERKLLLERHSDGFIAMPGGFGTLEEIFERINGAKLKLHSKPVYLFNINNYFDKLIEFLAYAELESFVSKNHSQLFKIIDNHTHILDDFMG